MRRRTGSEGNSVFEGIGSGPRPAEPELRCADANGYPIRLSSTEAIEAMDLPPPPPPEYENPKTLRHMENRLKALGYQIRSVSYSGGDDWSICLESGQTICFREGGEISLPWRDRDYRLERLFKMKPRQDQVARPLSSR